MRRLQPYAKQIAVEGAQLRLTDEDILKIVQEELAKLGIYVMFLPSYSPELNLIELLWQKIKYEWLPLDIYENFRKLSEGLFEVLKGIGSKYRITFG